MLGRGLAGCRGTGTKQKWEGGHGENNFGGEDGQLLGNQAR